MQRKTKNETQITMGQGDAAKTLVISGNVPNLHDDPKRVQQLLDVLGAPKGTHVQVMTTAASVIVR